MILLINSKITLDLNNVVIFFLIFHYNFFIILTLL